MLEDKKILDSYSELVKGVENRTQEAQVRCLTGSREKGEGDRWAVFPIMMRRALKKQEREVLYSAEFERLQ